VQVSTGRQEGSAGSPSAATTAMVSSLMSLKASPALVAAFLRTQPGTKTYMLAAFGRHFQQWCETPYTACCDDLDLQ
ncbi:hypothetical protein MMC14_010224, partial [Varicellaria rhodocarpa]|nr:hypothetical protein [Varicellaria rhodocarpa]